MDKATVFTRAQVGRASEDIALQIEAAIVSGTFEPGERLPSERELLVLFGTGRGVVREALQALRQKGLIEVKKGARGGAFVKQVEVKNASESLALFLKQQHVPVASIIEFRETLDNTITTLAIARGTREAKERLLADAESFERALSPEQPDMEALAEMDRQLNIQLVRMTGNPVFEWVMRTMQLGFSSQDQVLYQHPGYRRRTAANWKDTAREIAAGDPIRALSFIAYHYLMLRRCLDEMGGGAPDGENVFGTSPVVDRSTGMVRQ